MSWRADCGRCCGAGGSELAGTKGAGASSDAKPETRFVKVGGSREKTRGVADWSKFDIWLWSGGCQLSSQRGEK